MKSAPQVKNSFWTSPAFVWTVAGAILVALLPWLQRWLYLVPDLDQRIFLGRDFLELTAQRAYFYRALLEGKLALWDPLMATGLPFMEYLFDLFNPLSLLNAFFLEEGLLRSDYLQTVLAAYCSLAALGAFALGLELKLGRSAATVMGVVMGCMGVVTAHSEHSMMIQTFCWAPLVFLFLHRCRDGHSLFNAAWAGVFLGWSFMGGIPQIFYYVGVGATCYTGYTIIVELNRGDRRAAWRLALRPYLAMGLCALVWALPNLAHLALAGLGDPTGVHDAAALSGLRRLNFTAQYSGGWWVPLHLIAPRLMEQHAENTAYVGIVPLALALMAVAWARRGEAGFWKFLGLLGLVLMMGNSMGLHKVLLDVLPGYYLFRVTVRWMFLTHLALLVLAGYGLSWLLTRAGPEELAVLRRFLAVLVAMLIAIALAGMVVEILQLLPKGFKDSIPVMSFLAWLLFNLGVLVVGGPAPEPGRAGPRHRPGAGVGGGLGPGLLLHPQLRGHPPGDLERPHQARSRPGAPPRRPEPHVRRAAAGPGAGGARVQGPGLPGTHLPPRGELHHPLRRVHGPPHAIRLLADLVEGQGKPPLFEPAQREHGAERLALGLHRALPVGPVRLQPVRRPFAPSG